MKRWIGMIICIMLAFSLTACTAPREQGQGMQQLNTPGNQDAQLLDSGLSKVEVTQVDGAAYVDVGKMAGLIGFRTKWSKDGSNLLIGDHDVIWSFKQDAMTAIKEENEIKMDSPARKQQKQMLIPASSVQSLFQDEAVFTVDDVAVSIFPTPDYEDPNNNQQGTSEAFADDPADPSQRPDSPAASMLSDNDAEGQSVPIVAETIANQIIRDAKKFTGVPYEFGTGPYNETKRFDCSSFVRHVYNDYSFSLPRTARAQATNGTLVPRNQLRVGDLMYFYVPGRFKSNKKVGHVGIYMGNQQMIHSSPMPEDGVQITDINKNYWKDTYLYAKRPEK